ncbi:uncharacterized protein LOC110644645 isoform X1 [Hevea brasiliensis]|uniref:uncharacterized protein LOC110644645 isoform X1 n=1 Tax=Hevea brasiliensis TaxID=3981 RepID=UPI0025D50B91|nr:uncharacterized protein LOC110644645 isoform X1 [Hevea brasiliensis]
MPSNLSIGKYSARRISNQHEISIELSRKDGKLRTHGRSFDDGLAGKFSGQYLKACSSIVPLETNFCLNAGTSNDNGGSRSVDFEMSDPAASKVTVTWDSMSIGYQSLVFFSSLNHKFNAFARLNDFLSQSDSFDASLILQFATLLDPTTCYCLFKGNVSFISSVFV